MLNNELMEYLISRIDDTATLISLWGLAFYYKSAIPIIYSGNINGMVIKFNVTECTGMIAISMTNIIILTNWYKMYKLSEKITKTHRVTYGVDCIN